MAIPVAIRRKMLEAIQRGESIASVARRLEVTQQGLRTWHT
jgi:transposase-like protein